MYILGINISHHSSACLLKDGEILFHVENDRLTKKKLFGYQEYWFQNGGPESDPHFPPIDILKEYTTEIDYVIFSSYGQTQIDKKLIQKIGEKLTNEGITYKTKIFYHENHHLYHAATAFYGSGFEDSVALVMDGGGSYEEEFFEKNLKDRFCGWPFRETESIYKCSYKDGFSPLFKHYSFIDKSKCDEGTKEFFLVNEEKNYKEIFTTSISCGALFSMIAEMFGTGDDSAGKIMGLSSYGEDSALEQPKEEYQLKTLSELISYSLQDDWFYELNGEWVSCPFPWRFVKGIMDKLEIPDKFDLSSVREDDPTFQKCACIAKKLQSESEKHTIRLIQKALDISGSKNVVLSGGYFLNCVNNFKYIEHFPDVNFFIDPIAHDGGTAIGAAKWFWHGFTGDKTIRPLETLYLG